MADSGASKNLFRSVIATLTFSAAGNNASAIDGSADASLVSSKVSNIRKAALSMASTLNAKAEPYAARSPCFVVSCPPATAPHKNPVATQAACLPKVDPINSFPLLDKEEENTSAIMELDTITKNPPTTVFTMRLAHTLHTPGLHTTAKLAMAINPYNTTDGSFLPKESMSTPTNGDRKSSMAAEMAVRRARIWTAFACGSKLLLARLRVREGKGENITMAMDATIRKDV